MLVLFHHNDRSWRVQNRTPYGQIQMGYSLGELYIKALLPNSELVLFTITDNEIKALLEKKVMEGLYPDDPNAD